MIRTVLLFFNMAIAHTKRDISYFDPRHPCKVPILQVINSFVSSVKRWSEILLVVV